jgi:hypothetical protein
LKPLIAILLTVSLLMQGFNRIFILLNYQLNQAQITALFCVNKTNPEAACHGKCYLKKRLGQADAQSVPLSQLKSLLRLELFAQPPSVFVFATGPAAHTPTPYYPLRPYPAPVLPRHLPPKLGSCLLPLRAAAASVPGAAALHSFS